MRDARGHRHSQRLMMERMPRPGAPLACLAPHFAASTTMATGGSHGQFDRYRGPGAGLTGRQANLRAQPVDGEIRLIERVAHACDLVADGGKIDRYLVCERAIEFTIGRR